ncbi:hypothetical protein VCSRO188_0025 [Vibrio cholerae]|nr:hypothetical protein VCSRO188_0025 [Vibrio cholerae]
MNKYDVRRMNLERIRRELCGGNQTQLANRLGRQQSYVSRMLSSPDKRGHRKIADDMVDVITNAFNLPQGWLDGMSPHPIERLHSHHVPIMDIRFNPDGESLQIKETPYFTATPANFGQVDAYRVWGEELSPRIRHGDSIIVSKRETVHSGEDVFIWIKGRELPQIAMLIGERPDHIKVQDVSLRFQTLPLKVIAKEEIISIRPIVAIFRESYTNFECE